MKWPHAAVLLCDEPSLLDLMCQLCIFFQALADPVVLPKYVPSPTSVMTWQIGDCIDKSIVLASLLIGVGYDAYVVIGCVFSL